MIIADTITCRLPSDTSLKLNELYCTVANPVDSASSQTWATWLSAIATVGLLIFAIAAWRNSRQTLDHMREQMEATERRSILERQLPLLTAFVNAMGELKSVSLDRELEFKAVRAKVDDAWVAWSISLESGDAEFRKIAGKLLYFLSSEVRRIWQWRDIAHQASTGNAAQFVLFRHYPDEAIIEERQNRLIININNYNITLQNWQVDEANRKHELCQMKLILSQYE